MGSGYFGEPNLGNERTSGGSSSSSSSSRKGKKINNQDRPKQPQRGLGVAQLEKIRLHGQMASAGYHPSLHTPSYPPSNFNNEDPRAQIPYSSVPSSSFAFSSSSTPYATSYGFQRPNFLMGLSECEKTNIRYGGDSQPNITPRWEHANSILESQPTAQCNIARPFLNLNESQDIDTLKHRSGSVGSETSDDAQELDLELRL